MTTRFKPPMTANQLNEIQARRKVGIDIDVLREDNKALLLEVARLRASIRKADQFYRSLTQPIICNSVVLDIFQGMMEKEPTVQESRARREDLLKR